MIKRFAFATLLLLSLAGFSYGQQADEAKYRKISQMIGDSRKVGGIFIELLGGMMPISNTTESTVLSAIHLPNSVKANFTGRVQKIAQTKKRNC